MASATLFSGKGRLNPALSEEKIGGYTLRETPVAHSYRKALAQELPLIDARLGDPTVFGFLPPKRYRELVAELQDKCWGYTAAQGDPTLAGELSSAHVPTKNIFIRAGISGAVRSILTDILGAGDEVCIPKWSYIIYLAESAIRDASIVNITLDEAGQIKTDDLERNINERTKAIFITTVGNPLGVAIEEKSLREIIRVVNEKERIFNRPIYLFTDIIYEEFRIAGAPLDTIKISVDEKRIGPTIELMSISKAMSAPGARLGWAKVYWGGGFEEEKLEFTESLGRLVQPTLGPTSPAYQKALAKFMGEIRSSQERKGDYESYIRSMKAEVNRRVLNFTKSLAAIPGIVFPSCYYDSAGSIDAAKALNSFYVLFGIDKNILPRNPDKNYPLARNLADYLIESSHPRILLGTPGDSFLQLRLRGNGDEQEYMRTVALFDDSLCEMAVEGIRKYVEHVKKR